MVEEEVVVGLFETGLRFFVWDVKVVRGVVLEEVAAICAVVSSQISTKPLTYTSLRRFAEPRIPILGLDGPSQVCSA